MDEYIEREVVIRMLEAKADMCAASGYDAAFQNAAKMVKLIPEANVAPVVHAQWQHREGDYAVARCDRCKQHFDTTWNGVTAKEYFVKFAKAYKYCPNCGAKMDGGVEDEV